MKNLLFHVRSGLLFLLVAIFLSFTASGQSSKSQGSVFDALNEALDKRYESKPYMFTSPVSTVTTECRQHIVINSYTNYSNATLEINTNRYNASDQPLYKKLLTSSPYTTIYNYNIGEFTTYRIERQIIPSRFNYRQLLE